MDGRPRDAETVDAADAGTIPDAGPNGCVEVEPSLRTFADGPYTATASVTQVVDCRRTYTVESDAPLRDHPHGNPRLFSERIDRPRVRTPHLMFDALYALAMEEIAEASVSSIQDGAFDEGRPVPCDCFETGRLWRYVWTRDTAYAADLGLAEIDPERTVHSLLFKLSTRRDGTDLQIVQDTGSGGGYPISSDRVVWALGASRVLDHLEGDARSDFAAQSLEAFKNTIAHDRALLFDPIDGLYRGEQSFLDWREQSYPDWTAMDVGHIGMSKALSTNVAHWVHLSLAAKLAGDAQDPLATTYAQWAEDLRGSIRAAFLRPDRMPAYVNSTLDGSLSAQSDLLGTALAILAEVPDEAEAERLVASYPHTPMGAPVIWPQQPDVPIYHNRALWPFVTAYWLLAAKKVQNPAAFDRAAFSLIRGAALNLSNMENFEMMSGLPFVEDGAASGPIVNSQRQLWSVAGYVALVHRGIFGVEATEEGLRVAPYLSPDLATRFFVGARELTLENLTMRGRRITIVLRLPVAPTGPLEAGSVMLNGQASSATVPWSELAADNVLEIDLVPASGAGTIREVVGTGQALFAPRSPRITGVTDGAAGLTLALDLAGEPASDVTLSVYRDGQPIVEGLPGATQTWVDTQATAAGPSHCYTLKSVYSSSGHVSASSPAVCWWGVGGARVTSVFAAQLQNVGGTFVDNHGRPHYEAWGDVGHSLTLPAFTPAFSGPHWLQVVFGNGAGPVSTGITCGVKRIEVEELGAGGVGGGYLVMPHQGAWDVWRDSNLVPVDLRSDRTYRIRIFDEPLATNMSVRSHFEQYTGGAGGAAPFNRVNIAELKILARTGAP